MSVCPGFTADRQGLDHLISTVGREPTLRWTGIPCVLEILLTDTKKGPPLIIRVLKLRRDIRRDDCPKASPGWT